MGKKICGKCKITKTLNNFHKDIRSQDKKCTICKDCRKQYVLDNKEKIRQYQHEYDKKYYKMNREKLCHYSNLQPLWANDNLKKKNKLY